MDGRANLEPVPQSEPVIEELDWDACLQLLATETVGRLAVARPAGAPHLVPVNYTLLRESVVFRSAPGTKLDLLITEPVTFEVDRWDSEARTGWSVVVQGLAYEASDREMEVEQIRLPAFVERQNSRWVRLMPASITGRRIVRPSATPERSGSAEDGTVPVRCFSPAPPSPSLEQWWPS